MNSEEPDFALLTLDALIRIRVFVDSLPFTSEQKLDLMRGAYFGRLIASKGWLNEFDKIGNTHIDDLLKAEGKELKESISRYRAAAQGAVKPEGVILQ